MNLKTIIEGRDTKAGRIFDLFIQVLILISLISFSLETLPRLSDETRRILWIIEVVTVMLFSIEYILRILVADNRWKYIFSFFGIFDLLAILPFYLASGLDLRSLRIFRLLRLFRFFKLIRYNQAIQRLHKAFLMTKEELILFTVVTAMLLYASAVAVYYFERQAQPEAFGSVFHSLWWAVATLTTVGYGDVYPVTTGGRVFTFFILMIGLGVVAMPAGLIASALSKIRSEGS